MSGQVFFLTVLIFSFIILTYYSIALLGGLILPAPLAIQNWDQLMKSDLHLGIEDDRYLRKDLQTDDIKSKQILKKLGNTDKIFFPADEGLEKVRKGGFAFHNIVLDNYVKVHDRFTESEICSLSEIDKILKSPIGPFGQENGPYKEHFRRAFQLLNENGIKDSQLKFWISGMPECHWKQEKVYISIKALTVAFIVLSTGLFTSIVIFLVEIYFYKKISKDQIPFLH